jgi:hypothetical protein
MACEKSGYNFQKLIKEPIKSRLSGSSSIGCEFGVRVCFLRQTAVAGSSAGGWNLGQSDAELDPASQPFRVEIGRREADSKSSELVLYEWALQGLFHAPMLFERCYLPSMKEMPAEYSVSALFTVLFNNDSDFPKRMKITVNSKARTYEQQDPLEFISDLFTALQRDGNTAPGQPRAPIRRTRTNSGKRSGSGTTPPFSN